MMASRRSQEILDLRQRECDFCRGDLAQKLFYDKLTCNTQKTKRVTYTNLTIIIICIRIIIYYNNYKESIDEIT